MHQTFRQFLESSLSRMSKEYDETFDWKGMAAKVMKHSFDFEGKKVTFANPEYNRHADSALQMDVLVDGKKQSILNYSPQVDLETIHVEVTTPGSKEPPSIYRFYGDTPEAIEAGLIMSTEHATESQLYRNSDTAKADYKVLRKPAPRLKS